MKNCDIKEILKKFNFEKSKKYVKKTEKEIIEEDAKYFENKKNEQKIRIAKTYSCFVPDEKYNISNFNDKNNNKKLLINILQNFEKVMKNGAFLYFYGKVGRGKTHFVHTIMFELLQKNIKICSLNVEKYLTEIRNTYKNKEKSEQEYINIINNMEVLILDDIQFNNISDFAYQKIFDLVDFYYKNKKPIMLTGNDTPQDLFKTIYTFDKHKRIIDRLNERFKVFNFDGHNFRNENKFDLNF